MTLRIAFHRRALLATTALAFGLGIGAAPAAAQATSSAQPVRGGTLFAAIHPQPSVLIVAVNNQYANAAVSANIFDGLLTYDEQQRPQPSLATAWTVSPDGKTITFKLRQNVKWHDGAPFTSADVRYNVLEVWKKVHARGRVTFAPVIDVETPDAHTAVFKLDRPAPVILNALSPSEAQLLPRHLYEGTDVRTNPWNVKPIGTGAFRFKEWRRNEFIELVRNPDYWEAGKPYLDRVIYRAIPDAAGRSAALETGEIQYLPYSGVPFADVARLRQRPELVFETRGYDYSAQIYVVEFNLRRPYVEQQKVRQAFAHAIDKQALINTVWYGVSKPVNGPIPPVLKQFYTEDKPTYDFDPKKAEQLLDEAGFARKANGERFAITFTPSPSTEAYAGAAEFIRQNMQRVGVTLNIVRSDGPTYIRKIYTDYDFDMLIQGYSVLLDPELGLTRILWSKGATKGVPYVNASNYANPKVDKIIEGYQREPNTDKRRKLFHDLQREVNADLPILPIMDAPFFTFHSRKLQGLKPIADASRASLKDVWLAR